MKHYCSKEIIIKLKMKIFRTYKKNYAILGIELSNQSTQKYPFNPRVFFGFLSFGCAIIFEFVYIFHVANAFMEYVVAICTTSGTIIMLVCFAAIVFKRNLLFDAIDITEKLIDTSEYNFEFSIHVFIDEHVKIVFLYFRM